MDQATQQQDQPMHEYVLEKLTATKGKWPAVAAASGIPYRTLQKIAMRDIVDPGVSHIQKLADYFRAEEAKAA